MAGSAASLAVEPEAQTDTAARDAARGNGTQRNDRDATGEALYLIGRPPLSHLLRYVRTHAVTPAGKKTLGDTWEAARKVVLELERTEAGLADDPPMGKLGPEYEPLLRAFLKDPLVRHGFNTVPTDVALVELDRLVVFQKHVDVSFARELERRLGPAPSDEVIFRTCLPYDHPQPPVKWSRVHKGKCVFLSPSNDLRFLGHLPLTPRHLNGYPPPGDLVGVLGLAVGFGSNFMNAIYAEKRLILNNGSHRAYALRRLGITHVPCIVQHVSSRAEWELVASSKIRGRADRYLKHPRPSMLRDYFNPKLHLVMAVHRLLRQVTVRFEVEQEFVPAV